MSETSPPIVDPEQSSIKDDELCSIILTFLQEQSNGKPVHPSLIARSIAGKNEKEWRLLMKPLRRAAVNLAQQGDIEILRKGKVTDPNAFKGVYKIRLAASVA